MLGFVAHLVSVTTTELCHCSTSTAIDSMQMKWAWLCLNKTLFIGTSLVVQWVRLHAPNAGGFGSIPGHGTRSCTHATAKSLHATTKSPHATIKKFAHRN